MRQLHAVDWAIIAGYVLFALGIGVFFLKRASSSVEQFFVSGRSLPWWLAGTSMAATNFSIDTPVAISGLVAKEGIAGVWFFWASGIAAMGIGGSGGVFGDYDNDGCLDLFLFVESGKCILECERQDFAQSIAELAHHRRVRTIARAEEKATAARRNGLQHLGAAVVAQTCELAFR